MNLSTLEWLLSFASSWALFGLIWVIQLVHYPSFVMIDKDKFHEFHQHHVRSIGIIVMPLMLIELGLSIWLAWQYGVPAMILLGVVMLIWLSTFIIQVPLHNKLITEKENTAIRKLVNSNWIRTALWSLKAVLISYWYWIG